MKVSAKAVEKQGFRRFVWVKMDEKSQKINIL